MPAENEYYNQIKNALDIADIIGEKVKLRKSSRGYMGLCPFHNEKTPSFHVYTDTQSYYCFACHEAGDIFTFTMKTENLPFREAFEILADRAGISLKNYANHNAAKNLHDVMNMAAKFFTNILLSAQGTAARAYMTRRNLGASDVEKFSLGYAPNSWDALTNYLRRGGISDRQILNCGLALQNSRGIYDRFRGRIIFPVKDIAGRVVAFGGRLIDGEGAKYINSPENEIYSKRKILYLLNDARKFIREKGRSILVEGYMDALRLHKCGYSESVASLGTSLTGEQAELLASYADRCYICYDSDNAGKAAAIRGMYILQSHGLDVHVINIPEGKDPDEFLSANEPEKFEELIKNARPLVLQHIEILRPALNDPAKRKSAVKELFSALSSLGIDEILQYRAPLCEVTLLPPSELERRLLKNLPMMPEKKSEPVKKVQHENILEAGFCAMLMNFRECRLSTRPEEIFTLLNDETARDTALAILTGNVDNLYQLWLTMNELEKISLIKRGEEFCNQIQNMTPREMWQKILCDLKIQSITRKIQGIREKLQRNSATNEDLQELMKLQREKDSIICT